ncbi:PIG-L deacetylase family protein [Catalinimonas niigatensis]|uniref:PIG-L deacetylase family protein n=1 Tax=Catalinimonas niigatensis TaxID=1397264 RepID=UPI00266502E6|nr:PIG-L deacetylase family protein [Catalinimonas niigatensis]WPP51654.1 PIG-L deacetylase family protein [Catalinimonas niigatensis]
MLKNIFFTCLLLVCTFTSVHAQTDVLRIVVIGAHPDDADIKAAGTAILWAKMGHEVKFVSVTNGDAGHQTEGGGALAMRRMEEARESAKRMGITAYVILDNHDAELVPSLDIRKQVIREIRKWDADLVITHRTNDYHPDHRYTGVLVQDAAFLVAVPNVCPDTPPLEKNPVFMYLQDNFMKPYPFQPDIVVAIDEVFEQKINALEAHESQFYEWLPWVNGRQEVPADPVQRKQMLRTSRTTKITPTMHTSLVRWYGQTKANEVKHAEAFEICEYGTQPSEDMIHRLFPMLGK